MLTRLKYAQEDLAEKQRKEQLALAKKKEKAKNSNNVKIEIKSVPLKALVSIQFLYQKTDGKSVLKNETIIDFDDRLIKSLEKVRSYMTKELYYLMQENFH